MAKISDMIYTSSWSTKLPENFKRIGISRGSPRRSPAGYIMYRALAPGREWLETASTQEFFRLYMEILSQLDPKKVVDDIIALAGDKTPVLLCFESPTHLEKWCHRGLTAAWLHQTLGLSVFEYGHEHEGCGWSHPKLPPEFRRTNDSSA